MKENGLFPEWPEVWQRVYTGYLRHISVLKEILNEQKELKEQGYGDPTDGFVRTALKVTEQENQALWEAQKGRDPVALMQCLERTLQGLRWYGEADLSWSAVWEIYRAEFEEWLKNIRHYLGLGYQDPQKFMDYTEHRWTL